MEKPGRVNATQDIVATTARLEDVAIDVQDMVHVWMVSIVTVFPGMLEMHVRRNFASRDWSASTALA